MTIKNFLFRNQTYFFVTTLVFISFFVNQFYAYIGVLPVDSFSTFNSGYDILNGTFPFKDFWSIKGPTLDFIQALYFKIFGISWASYAAHSSSFNTLFALSFFFTIKQFNLSNIYSFFYATLASILMYPTYGTPFTDHHVSIFSSIAVFCLCLAIKTNKNIYWFFIPILIFLGFFTKQTPVGYFGILISLITLLYFIRNFRKKILLLIFCSSLLSIFIFFYVVFTYKIPIESIIIQYFLFPISLGETRIEWLLPFEFQRFVFRHKLIYIALSVPIFLLIKSLFKNFFSILENDNLIFILLIGTLVLFITHQLMTINGLFIYFLIPVFAAFSHIYCHKFKKNKNLINFFLILSLISTIYYHEKYISKRDTLILRNISLKNSINAKIIDSKFENLKWITHHYPQNPKREVQYLLDTIEIIKNDDRKKMLVTDYQFISVILDINDNSAARIWWRHHIYPVPNSKYFLYWKNFLLNKISNENIEVIYTIHPLEGEVNIFEGLISEKCYITKNLNKILVSQIIADCEEIK